MDTIKNSLCNLSLRLDLSDSTASLEHLKTWNPQNFTSILNKPVVKTKLYNIFSKILLLWKIYIIEFTIIKAQSQIS